MASPKKRGGIAIVPVPDDVPSPPSYNVEIQTSGTIYNQTVTGPLHGIEVQASGNYDVRIAFTSGDLPNKGWTIFAGSAYSREFDALWPTLTLYVKSDFDDTPGGEASRGVEILAWQDGGSL